MDFINNTIHRVYNVTLKTRQIALILFLRKKSEPALYLSCPSICDPLKLVEKGTYRNKSVSSRRNCIGLVALMKRHFKNKHSILSFSTECMNRHLTR